MPLISSHLLAVLLFSALWQQPTPEPRRAPPTRAQIQWAHIIMGEAGPVFPEGMELVAWTLRAWELNYGMDPASLGKETGWYGYAEPSGLAWEAMYRAWGRPLNMAPYAFMRGGGWCRFLGSNEDRAVWQAKYFYRDPDFHLTHPRYPNYGMNCWSPPWVTE